MPICPQCIGYKTVACTRCGGSQEVFAPGVMDRDSGILPAADPSPTDGNPAPPVVPTDECPVAAMAVSIVHPVVGAELVYKISEFPFSVRK
jgi:hypothetical protein